MTVWLRSGTAFGVSLASCTPSGRACVQRLAGLPLPFLALPLALAEAIQTAQPSGVDVSSGVCGPDGLKKDAAKVVGFVSGAQQAFAAQRQRQVSHR